MLRLILGSLNPIMRSSKSRQSCSFFPLNQLFKLNVTFIFQLLRAVEITK